MKTKDKVCNAISSNESERNDCMQNFGKFITIKTIKLIGNIALNMGALKIIEHLSTVLV